VLERETSRAFAAVSAQLFAFENSDLASQLASYNFLSEPAENTEAAEVAAGERFNLAGLTGLEPATSGVTGRTANRTARFADCKADVPDSKREVRGLQG
jgi:hypothetical protein